MKQRPNYWAGAAAGLWLLVVTVPLYVMISAALRTQPDYAKGGPLAPPVPPTTANLTTVLQGSFPRYVLNTALVTVAVIAIVVVLVAPLAYAIARRPAGGTAVLFRLFLLGLAIPVQAVAIPVYYLISAAGLYDNLVGIILPTAAFCLPVSTLVLTGTMRDIARELYEAMALDGAGAWRAFWRLALPLARPGLATVVVFSALQSWNGFLFPLVLTQSPENKTVPLGLFDFQTQFSVNTPALMAAVLLSALPVLVVYLFARRALITGLMGVGGK